jgi:hypothetical protein
VKRAAAILAAAVLASLSPAEMCRIIQQDITAYLATGRLCACPYSLTRGGAMCGNRSAWAKPDGARPRCYFGDVDGSTPPNRRPNPPRQSWPDPPPCAPTT